MENAVVPVDEVVEKTDVLVVDGTTGRGANTDAGACLEVPNTEVVAVVVEDGKPTCLEKTEGIVVGRAGGSVVGMAGGMRGRISLELVGNTDEEEDEELEGGVYGMNTSSV